MFTTNPIGDPVPLDGSYSEAEALKDFLLTGSCYPLPKPKQERTGQHSQAQDLQLSPIETQYLEGTTAKLNLYDFILDDNMPSHFRRYQPRLQPKTDLSLLESLPFELLACILSEVDVPAIENFRLVNRRAVSTVQSHPQYWAIITHASKALRGILAIETGR